MRAARKIVTRHFVERTANRELGRLWKVQEGAALGRVADEAELNTLGITAQTKLAVRHERRRFYKWAVVAL